MDPSEMASTPQQVASAPNDVDVIVLSWNRAEDLLEAIASALAQTGPNRRILIVDQGSEPQHIEKLEHFIQGKPDILLKKMGRNTGVAGGRNIATAMGQGRYIVALDSDAIFADASALARAVRHLDAHPNLGAIGFRIENYFTGQNDALSWDYPGRSPDHQFHTTRFIGAGHAIRRSAFEAVGGYDTHLFFCGEELDLCYRMLNLGFRIEYLPDVKVRHKVSPDHRIAWERGRYFYTVRNALYSSYKFGIPKSRLSLAAMAFLVRGAVNGVAVSALTGVWAAIRLCAAYKHSTEDKTAYQLSRDTWSYIKEREPWRTDGIAVKIWKQFTKLPVKA
jgi:GT2 family glycosyltransferase